MRRPAQAIKLVNNVSNGDHGSITVTFGLDGYKQTQQNQQYPDVPFKIVATQHGVNPLANG